MLDWTASKIDAANYCIMRFYLRYFLHNPGSRLPVFEKGGLLHSTIEHFWERLGSEEEAAKKSSPIKYSNHEEFKKYLSGKWMQRIISEENSAKIIEWNFPDQKYFIKNQLEQMAQSLFDHLVEEGKPLHTEFPFKFILGNKRFAGRIDELRIENGVIIIRDYKSGIPWLDETKLKGDPQLTFYNAGLNMLLKQNRDLRKYFINKGADENLITFEEGIINPNFYQEFFMIEALPRIANPKDFPMMKTIPEARLSAPRKEEHFSELVKMIDGTMQNISHGRVYPERGRKCANCDMKGYCDKELDMVGTGYLVDKHNQLHLSFNIPDYRKKNNFSLESRSVSNFGTMPKKITNFKNPRQTKLRLRKKRIKK